MVDPAILERAVSNVRLGTKLCGHGLNSLEDVESIANNWPTIAYPDDEQAEAAYAFAARVVANELGLLTGHERIALARSLAHAEENGQ